MHCFPTAWYHCLPECVQGKDWVVEVLDRHSLIYHALGCLTCAPRRVIPPHVSGVRSRYVCCLTSRSRNRYIDLTS